jgi:antirestriction protein
MTKTNLISIYVANLGAYSRGYLVGEWIPLPCDNLDKKINNILNGNDAQKTQSSYDHDEEVAIHDFECDFLKIGEYDNINTLNEIAERLEALDQFDIEKLKAIFEHDSYSMKDLKRIIDNLDEWTLLTDVNTYEDLGYYWIEESGYYDLSSMGNLAYYFDYEMFGRDVSLESSGGFTKYGFLYK